MIKLCPWCNSELVVVDTQILFGFLESVDIYGCMDCGYREDEDEKE